MTMRSALPVVLNQQGICCSCRGLGSLMLMYWPVMHEQADVQPVQWLPVL